MDKNRLAESGSPYLEQHADNPVLWQVWGEEAFKSARLTNRPVLVSIGYSSCHWCHVMAHESFEDENVAELMNSALVNIKVDREQHPGVDAIYMEAAQALTGSGGWPLNVFVDHDGKPFLAVTYLPPEQWTDLIVRVDQIWKEDRPRINEIAATLTEHLSERRFPPGTNLSTLPATFLENTRQHYDSDNPGFVMGGRPMKFPPSQTIGWLMEHGGEDGRIMALNILTAMMDSGLHDRMGGGFHRYSVDAIWRVPHFEKMAYDNAQLMGLYARAASLTGPGPSSDKFLSVARGTAGWFINEMRIESGTGEFQGYATSTDADDPLGEGTYFAWPLSAMKEALGTDDAKWLAHRWNISGDGELPASAEEGHYEPIASWIPHPRGAVGYPGDYSSTPGGEDAAREIALILRLRAVRVQRPAPARDDKVLTDQNALILEGFVRVARYGGGETYLAAAIELADLLIERFDLDSSPAGITAQISKINRAPGIEAYISDYGYLAMALSGAYGLVGNPTYIRAAETVVNDAIRRLSVGDGAFFSTPDNETGLYKRAIEEFDGPTPAGQHALGIALARLYAVTGNPEWKERADDLLISRGAVAAAAPSAAPSLVRLASIRTEPYTLVVAGPANHPDTAILTEITRRFSGPDLMVVTADRAATNEGESWVEIEGRTGLDQPQLLVCREGNCLLPAYSQEDVMDRLKQIGQGN